MKNTFLHSVKIIAIIIIIQLSVLDGIIDGETGNIQFFYEIK